MTLNDVCPYWQAKRSLGISEIDSLGGNEKGRLYVQLITRFENNSSFVNHTGAPHGINYKNTKWAAIINSYILSHLYIFILDFSRAVTAM